MSFSLASVPYPAHPFGSFLLSPSPHSHRPYLTPGHHLSWRTSTASCQLSHLWPSSCAFSTDQHDSMIEDCKAQADWVIPWLNFKFSGCSFHVPESPLLSAPSSPLPLPFQFSTHATTPLVHHATITLFFRFT